MGNAAVVYSSLHTFSYQKTTFKNMLDYPTKINNPKISDAYFKKIFVVLVLFLSSHTTFKVSQQEPQLTVCIAVVQLPHSLYSFLGRCCSVLHGQLNALPEMHISSGHISLVKANCIITPNFKRGRDPQFYLVLEEREPDHWTALICIR